MDNILIQYYKTPYGELVLGSFANQLCLCDWRYRKMRQAIDKRLSKGLNAGFKEQGESVINDAISQLEEYFSGKRLIFDIDLLMIGTYFQKAVWHALFDVAYGKTATYLQLADRIGNINAVRAVAGANGANAISIFIPCHRIIGSDGALVGYAGGMRAKKKLLQLEEPEPLWG